MLTPTLVVLGLFVLLLVADLPIALAMAAAALCGIVMIDGFAVAAKVLGAAFYGSAASYALFVIPMYVLLGALMANAGIGEQIYRTVHRVVGWLPAGVATTAIGATALFSGISGSSAADTATFGRISVNEMARHGYSKSYAAAVVAAAGTFASLIPPSISIVIYCVLAEQSIGRMIIAAIVPGVISAGMLALFVIGRAIFSSPEDGMGALKSKQQRRAETQNTAIAKAPWWSDLLGATYAIVIFAIVVGGLNGGYFTPTEAGAIAAFVALIIMMAALPRSASRSRVLATSLRETTEVTCMIFMLLIAGGILGYFVSSSGLASDLIDWTKSLALSPKLVVGCILLLILPMGMFLDGLTIMLMIVPVTAKLVEAFGFDGAWYGVLVLKCIEIGLITPPVGINVFIVSGITGIPPLPVFNHLRLFVLLDVVVTLMFFLFPSLTLWLPRVMGY